MTEEVKKQPVSLKSLLTPSKTVSIDYPGYEGFAIDLCYLSREELVKLRNKCLKQKFNKKTRAFEDSLDEELFLTGICFSDNKRLERTKIQVPRRVSVGRCKQVKSRR